MSTLGRRQFLQALALVPLAPAALTFFPIKAPVPLPAAVGSGLVRVDGWILRQDDVAMMAAAGLVDAS